VSVHSPAKSPPSTRFCERFESLLGVETFTIPGWGAVLVFGVLMAVGQLMDPGGFLSTDVGGKVATLDAMSAGHTLSPDLGYWAASADPGGLLYPMFSTTHVGGAWVNVTSLPMMYLALPFHAIGGPRLALVVPVLGLVLAALAARALAIRIGATDRRAAAVFWVVALASPATVYALSIWEHTVGLALMAWGVVAAVDVLNGPLARSNAARIPLRSAVLTGLAFGAAASMRQEALVYGFVVGVALVVGQLWMRRTAAAAVTGAAMAFAGLAALFANALLELAVLGSSTRSARSTATAGSASSFVDTIGTRLGEAVTTGTGIAAASTTSAHILGLALLMLLVVAGMRADRPDEVRFVMVALAVVFVVSFIGWLIDGMGFVPGMVAAAPLAGIGLANGWRPGPSRFVTGVAVGGLPLIWATEYLGGAGPQWGGRYILLSGLLLTVVAVVNLDTDSAWSVGRRVAVAGFAVTMAGIVWSGVYTHSFADASQDLAQRPEPVLVFGDPHVAREAGSIAVQNKWLAAIDGSQRDAAVGVVQAMGYDEFGYVEVVHGPSTVEFSGWIAASVEEVGLVGGSKLRITTWTTSG